MIDPNWGSRGRRFKSCRPDSPKASRAGDSRKERVEKQAGTASTWGHRATMSFPCGLLSLLSDLPSCPSPSKNSTSTSAPSISQTPQPLSARRVPRGYGYLADQLNRASLSIAANIAEGNGRFTARDRRHFFIIARGSIQECVPLLELAARRELLLAARHKELKADLEEIARMLSGLIRR